MKEKKTKDGSAVCYASAEFSHGSRHKPTVTWLTTAESENGTTLLVN